MVEHERGHVVPLEGTDPHVLHQRLHGEECRTGILHRPEAPLLVVARGPFALRNDSRQDDVGPRQRKQRGLFVLGAEIGRDEREGREPLPRVRGERGEPHPQRAAGAGTDDEHGVTEPAADLERLHRVGEPVL